MALNEQCQAILDEMIDQNSKEMVIPENRMLRTGRQGDGHRFYWPKHSTLSHFNDGKVQACAFQIRSGLDVHCLLVPKPPSDSSKKMPFYNVAIGECGNSVNWVHFQESKVQEEHAKNWGKFGHDFIRNIGGYNCPDLGAGGKKGCHRPGFLDDKELRWFWVSKSVDGTIELGQGHRIGEMVIFSETYENEKNVPVDYFCLTTMCSTGEWMVPSYTQLQTLQTKTMD